MRFSSEHVQKLQVVTDSSSSMLLRSSTVTPFALAVPSRAPRCRARSRVNSLCSMPLPNQLEKIMFLYNVVFFI